MSSTILSSAKGNELPTTFGKTIAEGRRSSGASLRDLASRIKKEDGSAISAQYLNDIEHGRRNPPPAEIIRQLARELALNADYLLVLANDFPEDDQELIRKSEPAAVEQALQAFRRTLKAP